MQNLAVAVVAEGDVLNFNIVICERNGSLGMLLFLRVQYLVDKSDRCSDLCEGIDKSICAGKEAYARDTPS